VALASFAVAQSPKRKAVNNLRPTKKAASQQQAQRAQQPAVDVVTLKSGVTIRGAIVRQEENGSLVIAVPREWLPKSHPGLFDKAAQDESAAERAALDQLRDRVTKRLGNRTDTNDADESRFGAFLQSELERVQKFRDNAKRVDSLQFVWFEAANDSVAKVHRA